MKSYGRLVVILLIFLVPFGAWLYLKIGSSQPRYTLKYYGPREAVEVEINGEKGIDTLFHKVSDFTFTTQLGSSLSKSDVEGKIYVADFFFTNCMGICLQLSKQMLRIQEAFKDDEDVLLLSHTVDPARDSVGALKAYAESYGADNSKWHFLTGTKPDLYEQARKGYFVTATEGDGGPDDFVHTERFILVDQESHIRGYYDGTDSSQVDMLITDIKFLLWEENKGEEEGNIKNENY